MHSLKSSYALPIHLYGPSALQPRSRSDTTTSILDSSRLAFYPVSCLPSVAEPPSLISKDCDALIDHDIVAGGPPLQNYYWGYTADAEKRLPKAGYWRSGQCVVVVVNQNVEEIGIFNLMEVSLTARRITQKCLVATEKTSYGGTSHIGSPSQNFYVYVGGPHTLAMPLGPPNPTLQLPSTQKLKRTLARFKRANIGRRATQPGAATPAAASSAKSVKSLATSAASALPICGSGSFATRGAVSAASSAGPSLTRLAGSSATSPSRSTGMPFRGACIPASLASASIVASSIIRTVSSGGEPKKTVVPVYHALSPFDAGFVGGAGGGLFGRDAAASKDAEPSSSVGPASSAFTMPAVTRKPRDTSSTEKKAVNGGVGQMELEIRDLPSSSSDIKSAGGAPGTSGDATSNGTTISSSTDSSIRDVHCISDGMSAARGSYINGSDCDAVLKSLLSDPTILQPQTWTIEPTGGIKLPFVGYYGSCFAQIDISNSPSGGGSPLTTEGTFTLLKAVYYADEILQRCVVRQSASYGGTARLGQGEFFVSVTALDPRLGDNNDAILDTLNQSEGHSATVEDAGTNSNSVGQQTTPVPVPGAGKFVEGPVG
ncbi:MAG: hypothetical protein Q9217_006688 [Psora testacea]